MLPLLSSRNLATAAMLARAESLTDDGDWPSAQLMVASAVALLEAVLLQVKSVIVVLLLVRAGCDGAPKRARCRLPAGSRAMPTTMVAYYRHGSLTRGCAAGLDAPRWGLNPRSPVFRYT